MGPSSFRGTLQHGDIAPPNILCDRPRRVYKLSDFGVARYLKAGVVSRIPDPVFSSGRYDFMPYEHRLDRRRINPSTDVYALTVTYYALLTGKVFEQQPSGPHAGFPIVPGVIKIGPDGHQGSGALRAFFERFIVARNDNDTIQVFKQRFQSLG